MFLRPLIGGAMVMGGSATGAYFGAGRSPRAAALAAGGGAAGATLVTDRDPAHIIDGALVAAAGAAGAYFGGQDRRRAAVGAAIGAGVMLLLNAGRRIGFGSGGATSSRDAVPCKIRLDATSLTVNGDPVKDTDDAPAACKSTLAELVVTGDATMGNYDSLRQALDAAGIKVAERPHTLKGRR